MIVYREQRSRVATSDALNRIRRASGFERQMEIGELEAGIADALCPSSDTDHPLLRALRKWSLAPASEPPEAVRDAPLEIEISVPEGFAYYALDPELYRMASRKFVRENGRSRVAVIGIRSIGATLSSVVESQFRELGCHTNSWTVRPHGHPWDRSLAVSDSLARHWREWNGVFAVVDEGPGLSGSSFAAVAEALSGFGVADRRIVFFPSWDSDGEALLSSKGRDRWRRHRRYCGAFEELGLFEGATDLSGGKWREIYGLWPAVNPQHERRKYLRGGGLHKFAGYGRYGREKLERAGRLNGFTPQPCGLERGFMETKWEQGRPAPLNDAFVRYAAGYLALLRREFTLQRPPCFETLANMISVNMPEAPDMAPWRGPVSDGAAVALDARMFPHEWLETETGFLKLDALEHHDDHFLPGPQDIAWDIAGFAVEHDLDPSGTELLVRSYCERSGDHGISARLPFYRLAYLAFRLGYSDLAVTALGETADGGRFRALRERYRMQLDREVARAG